MTAVDGHAGRAHCAAHHHRPAGAANLSLRGRPRHGEVDRGGDSDVFIVEQPEASAYSYGAFHWCVQEEAKARAQSWCRLLRSVVRHGNGRRVMAFRQQPFSSFVHCCGKRTFSEAWRIHVVSTREHYIATTSCCGFLFLFTKLLLTSHLLLAIRK